MRLRQDSKPEDWRTILQQRDQAGMINMQIMIMKYRFIRRMILLYFCTLNRNTPHRSSLFRGNGNRRTPATPTAEPSPKSTSDFSATSSEFRSPAGPRNRTWKCSRAFLPLSEHVHKASITFLLLGYLKCWKSANMVKWFFNPWNPWLYLISCF